jgi:hypothetical protein
VDGLIENLETNTMPGNAAVRLDWGIVGEDDERLFEALRWAWVNTPLDREALTRLRLDGRALTRAVNVPGNPYAPVEYATVWDLVREWEATHPFGKDEA